MSPTCWVCAACGKVASDRMKVGDESCYLHAVECWSDSVILIPGERRIQAATAASDDWVPDLREVASCP
jgi:hypothetical protein